MIQAKVLFKPAVRSKALPMALTGSMLMFNVATAATFSTTPNDVVRTPGVGFQATLSHPPTLQQLRSCNFDDNDTELEAAGLKSGTRYVRLMWQDFEPVDDDFGYDSNDAFGINMLRQILDCSHREGKAVDLRISLAWPGFPKDRNASRGFPAQQQRSLGLPAWLTQKPGFYSYESRIGSPNYAYKIANWSSQVLWNEHAELIRKLGAEFDGHKALNAVDIGSVGFFGEWHYDLGNPQDQWLPSVQRRKDIVNLYYASFPNTPKMALEDPFNRATEYTPRQPDVANFMKNKPAMGWRADSWGGKAGNDRGYFNNRYNNEHVSLIPNMWKTGQISLEISGPTIGQWAPDSFTSNGLPTSNNYDYLWTSINNAVAWHASNINSKLGAIPQSIRNDLSYLAKKLGFRLVLWSASHSPQVTAGKNLNVSMTWENKGIAPAYRDFRVAFRLKNSSGNIVTGSSAISNLSVKGWLPGSPFYKTAIYKVPTGIPAGTYTLETGVVFHKALDTVLPIVVDQRNSDFWVPIGTRSLKVNAPSGGGISQSSFSRIVAGGSDSFNRGASNYDPRMWRIIDSPVNSGSWSNGGVASKAYVDLYLDRPRKISSVQYFDQHARKISVAVFDANGNWVHGIEEVRTQAGQTNINFPNQASTGGDVIGTRVSVWSDSSFGYVSSNGQLWFSPNEIKVFGSPE